MKNLFPFFTKLRSFFIYYIITQEFYTLYNIPILSWKDSTFNKSKNTRKPFFKMSKMRGNQEVRGSENTFSFCTVLSNRTERTTKVSWISEARRDRKFRLAIFHSGISYYVDKANALHFTAITDNASILYSYELYLHTAKFHPLSSTSSGCRLFHFTHCILTFSWYSFSISCNAWM